MIMVKAKIRCIVNEVLNAITDPELKELVRTKTFLTGGCFKAIYHDQEVNDYDFYFVDEESKNKFVKLIEVGLTKSSDEPFTDKKKLRLLDLAYKSEFTVTFRLTSADDKKIKIQFITKYVGLPGKVTSNFDFKHTMNYYVPVFDAFEIDENTLDKKELIFNERASHPINGLKRMQKFIQQGWTISDPEIMKIAEAINNLNLSDEKEYREQASGMYLYRESKMRGYNSRRSVG
jgi:hypothetical protein